MTYNCFRCNGHEQNCEVYKDYSPDICMLRNIATMDLIYLNNNNPHITLYTQMKEYFAKDKETLAKISKLEQMVNKDEKSYIIRKS